MKRIMNLGLMISGLANQIGAVETAIAGSSTDTCKKWKTDFTGEDFLRLASDLRTTGFENLELWDPMFSRHCHSENEALLFRRSLKSLGFQEIVYAVGPLTELNVYEVDSIFRFARALGCKIIIGSIRTPEVILPVLEQAGLQYDIQFAIENHSKPFLQSPTEIMKATKGYQTIGVCINTGIFTELKYDILKAYQLLKKKVIHIHFKENVTPMQNDVSDEEEDSPLLKLYEQLKVNDYIGMVSIETNFPNDRTKDRKSSETFDNPSKIML
jgi:sugar phosphate isomerase/epimerase